MQTGPRVHGSTDNKDQIDRVRRIGVYRLKTYVAQKCSSTWPSFVQCSKLIIGPEKMKNRTGISIGSGPSSVNILDTY